MKILRGFLSISFVFLALFGGSHPPASPGNPIKDLILEILGVFSCDFERPKPLTKNLVGTWQMSLVDVVPKIPEIPLADPIRKKSSWQISDSGGKLTIRYDGSTKWYRENSIAKFTVSAPSVTTYSDDTRCLFSGTGKTYIDNIPKIWEMPPVMWRAISVNYTDSVSITMNSDDTVTAIIKVIVDGQYTETGILTKKGQVYPINATEVITYTGVRR